MKKPIGEKLDLKLAWQTVKEHEWARVNRMRNDWKQAQQIYSIDPSKTALIVVDMQDFFLSQGSEIELPTGRDVVPKINALASACRESGIPVIWLKTILRPDLLDAGLMPNFQPLSGLAEGSSRTELWSELEIRPSDIVVVKKRVSAFISGSSDLERLLRRMDRDTLIIAGVATNICCESTARDASMLDFKVIFASDANGSFDEILHEISLMNLSIIFAEVATTEEIQKRIRSSMNEQKSEIRTTARS